MKIKEEKNRINKNRRGRRRNNNLEAGRWTQN